MKDDWKALNIWWKGVNGPPRATKGHWGATEGPLRGAVVLLKMPNLIQGNTSEMCRQESTRSELMPINVSVCSMSMSRILRKKKKEMLNGRKRGGRKEEGRGREEEEGERKKRGGVPCYDPAPTNELQRAFDAHVNRIPIFIETQNTDSKEREEQGSDPRVEHPIIRCLQREINKSSTLTPSLSNLFEVHICNHGHGNDQAER